MLCIFILFVRHRPIALHIWSQRLLFLFLFLFLLRWKRMSDIVECDFITSFIIPSVQPDVEAVSWHIIHSAPAGSSAAPTVLEAAPRLAGCLYCNSPRVFQSDKATVYFSWCYIGVMHLFCHALLVHCCRKIWWSLSWLQDYQYT